MLTPADAYYVDCTTHAHALFLMPDDYGNPNVTKLSKFKLKGVKVQILHIMEGAKGQSCKLKGAKGQTCGWHKTNL